jgi:thiol-disulfide isomerase/thioredoxin
MVFKNLKVLYLILFLILNNTIASYSQQNIDFNFKNLIKHPEGKTVPVLIFEDKNDQKVNVSQLREDIILVNFWATWCAPCKEEMPALDKMIDVIGKNKIKVIAVNIENIKTDQAEKFLKDLQIKNFESYFDRELQNVNKLSLRGIPITIILNKKRLEVGRVIGSINFADPKFIDWLKKI